jgi:hypothetical protein
VSRVLTSPIPTLISCDLLCEQAEANCLREHPTTIGS